MRPWYKIHRSTLGVIAVVVAWMIFINIPGDRALRDSRLFHHGWPYLYFEREGASLSWWSFAGASPEFHAPALALNILTALCIAALVACACELWIRRFGRLLRFSVASMLVVTALLAVIMGLVVRDVHRCYRQQQTLDELAKLGSMRATREERKYDWFRSLLGSNLDGMVSRIEVEASVPTEAPVPDLAALDALKFLSLAGVTLGPADVEQIATARKLETLMLTVDSLRGDQNNALKRISELPARVVHLTLNSDLIDDHSLSALTSGNAIKTLLIRSAKVTSDSLRELSQMESLEELWIEGAPLRDADFSPLAKAPKLKSVIFFRCNLSPTDERNLLALWPDGNLHTGTGPDGRSRLIQAFRMQQQASVDQGPGP